MSQCRADAAFDRGSTQPIVPPRQTTPLPATVAIGEQKIENDQTGWKFATSIGGIGTGERGDRVLLDDPHNVVQQDSAGARADTVRFFRGSLRQQMRRP
jgi:hypothetical protein